ncbi:tRNA epoxyqueuosine(34) reductase QueG, partial [Burkholderia pseudomallei]
AAPGGIGPDARAAIVAALRARLDDPCVSALVREHVEWALRAA